MQSNVTQLLSKDMQELMLHQSTYIKECAGLATCLESSDEAAPVAALETVDACWAQLLAALEGVQTGVGLFMLFNSVHAPPSHWMWYLLGGVKMSFVVRPPPCSPPPCAAPHAPAPLTRAARRRRCGHFCSSRAGRAS